MAAPLEAMHSAIHAPILVIGTHRSGTTFLGRTLGGHPDAGYWEEPRHVWSRGFNFRPDDSLSATDARPRVGRRIHRTFGRFLAKQGRSRLVEKTPSNCLRLPFIDAIFQDAIYLHIVRDGRAVVSSTDTMTRTRGPERRWLWRRLLGTPIWEWPAFVPRAWRTLGNRLLGNGMAYWGPQPPYWREWVRRDDRWVVLAKQWRYTVEPVLEFRSRVSAERWLDIRYEDLVGSPREVAERILDHCRLPPKLGVVGSLQQQCRQDRIDAWRAHLSPEHLQRMRPILEPLLERLHYRW